MVITKFLYYCRKEKTHTYTERGMLDNGGGTKLIYIMLKNLILHKNVIINTNRFH